MYIVNTSFFVDPEVQNMWLGIINGKYIPLLRQKGFGKVTFSRVLPVDPVSSCTYSLMVDADDLEGCNMLAGEIFDTYKEVALPLFGERVAWLTTFMKKLPAR